MPLLLDNNPNQQGQGTNPSNSCNPSQGTDHFDSNPNQSDPKQHGQIGNNAIANDPKRRDHLGKEKDLKTITN